MSCASEPWLTVLGVAPAASAARLAVLLGTEELPPLLVCRAGGLAGFAVRGRAWTTHRQALRAALHRATLASPFLPADPRQALCEAASWPRVIAAAAAPLAEALARDGAAQQWEVTIGPMRSGSAATLATRLRAAVLPHALGVRVRAARGGIVVAVLLPRAGGHAVREAAAEAADHGAAVSVEGPLPPLAFAAFRLERVESEAVARAWALLALRDVADADEIARRWRGLAFALDPGLDRSRRRTLRPLRAAERACGLLRGLTAGFAQRHVCREDVLALCGRTVAVPASVPASAAVRLGERA